MPQHTNQMAGEMQQQAQPMPAGQQAPMTEQGGGDKQAMFEQLAGPKLEYIYGNGLESVKGVLEAGANNPQQAIGDLVGKLLASSAMNARDNGVSVPPDVMTVTAQELTNNVTDIAVKMGVIDEASANDVGEEAFVTAIATFGEIAVGNAISPAEQKQYSQIVGEMRQLIDMKQGQSPEGQTRQEQPQQAAPQEPTSMAQAMG